MSSTGNAGLDALADAIARRVVQRIKDEQAAEECRLLDVPATARLLGSTVAAVRGLIAKGKIPAVRRGSRVFCDRVDLERWIEKSKVTGVE